MLGAGRIRGRRCADPERARRARPRGAGPRHREAPPWRRCATPASSRDSASGRPGRPQRSRPTPLPGEVVRRAPAAPGRARARPRADAARRARPRASWRTRCARSSRAAARPHARAPAEARAAAARGARRARRRRAHLAPTPSAARSALRRLEADLLRYVEHAAHGAARPSCRAIRAALRRRRRTSSARPSWPAASCGSQGRIDRIDVAPAAARRSSTTTRAARTAAGAHWVDERKLQVGALPARRCAQLLDLEAGRRPVPAARPRRRPASRAARCSTDADPGLDVVGRDRLRRRGDRGARRTASLAAGARGRARHPRGRAAAAPDDVRLRRRLRVPDDLPLRGGLGVTRAFTAEQARGHRAPRGPAAARRPAPARARRRCSSSASCARCVRGRPARRRRSSPSPSPRRRPASCARACAPACSSSASARRRARPRRAWITTFHGFCARVLRAHAVAAGLDPGVRGARRRRRPRGRSARPSRPRCADFLADAARRRARPRGRLHGRPPAADGRRGPRRAAQRAGRRGPALPPSAPAAPVAARAELDARVLGRAAELAGAERRRAVAAAREAARGLPRRARRRRDRRPEGREGRAHRERAEDARRRRLPRGVRRPTRDALADAAPSRRSRSSTSCWGATPTPTRRPSAPAAGLDFDDLELLARDLLPASRRIAAGYRERFERIMVDEFQDTNPLQLELLELVARDDAFTVGRRAAVDLRLPPRRRRGLPRAPRAPREARAATATLATNFRSRPEILRGAQRRLRAAARRTGSALRPGRETRAAPAPVVELLVTDADAWNGDAPGALGLGLPAASPVKQAEARLVAQRVAELVRGGRRARATSSCCCARRPRCGLFERALEHAGLPTLAAGGRGCWGRQQVRDLCHLLAVARQPARRGGAARRCWPRRWPGLSSDALALLGRSARARARMTIWEASHDEAADAPAARGRAAPGRVPRVVRGRARARAAPRARRAAPARASRARRYDLHVLALPRGARRLANVHKLLRLAADYEARAGRDVRGFIDLATAELEAEAREPDAPVELGGLDAVRLMTIHAAKGLEFGVVVRRRPRAQGHLQPARPPRQRATASACGSSGSTARSAHRAGLRRHRGRAPCGRRGRGAARRARGA